MTYIKRDLFACQVMERLLLLASSVIDPNARQDPPLGMPDPPRDWFEFWVRFICGGLFGIVMSGLLWLRDLGEFPWICIPAAGLICAFAAARYGDAVWTSLRFIKWW